MTAALRLLTDEELVELTGVEQPAAQMRRLREYGLNPFPRPDGRPRLTWSALDAAMTAADKATPDWSAIRGRA